MRTPDGHSGLGVFYPQRIAWDLSKILKKQQKQALFILWSLLQCHLTGNENDRKRAGTSYVWAAREYVERTC